MKSYVLRYEVCTRFTFYFGLSTGIRRPGEKQATVISLKVPGTGKESLRIDWSPCSLTCKNAVWYFFISCPHHHWSPPIVLCEEKDPLRTRPLIHGPLVRQRGSVVPQLGQETSVCACHDRSLAVRFLDGWPDEIIERGWTTTLDEDGWTHFEAVRR